MQVLHNTLRAFVAQTSCVGHKSWFIHNFGVRTTVNGAAGNFQATTESVLPTRSQYRRATPVITDGLYACAHDTCAHDARDLGCETANTIRQYMEHASARVFCNHSFLQRLLQRLFLGFVLGSGSCCGRFSTSSVQYHQ